MDRNLQFITAAYLILINIAGFCAMGLDKRKAKKQKWRIPEARLFLLAIIGGSLGSWAGMYVFRHKTKHWRFVIGMPVIFAAQVILGVCLAVFIKGEM